LQNIKITVQHINETKKCNFFNYKILLKAREKERERERGEVKGRGRGRE